MIAVNSLNISHCFGGFFKFSVVGRPTRPTARSLSLSVGIFQSSLVGLSSRRPDGRLRLLHNGRSVCLIFFGRSVGLCRRSIRRSTCGVSIDHTAFNAVKKLTICLGIRTSQSQMEDINEAEKGIEICVFRPAQQNQLNN